jgi:hypothetical protein
VNGLNNKLADNEKVKKEKGIHIDSKVDIVVYNKHQLNMKHQRNINRFNQLFHRGKTEFQYIVAHNLHKNIGWYQQGGTSLMLFDPLIEQLNLDQSRKDTTGLGC